MSSSRVALCEHILYEHFGSAVGRVSSVLLARGRLSYETLIRLIPSKVLTQRAIMASLLVLVQHNCLFHILDDEDGFEYFEMDIEEVLQRRRYGTFIAVARDTWSKKGAEVIARVLGDGKIRLSTLLEDIQNDPKSSNSSSFDRRQIVKVIYDLLNVGALRPVKAHDHHPVIDQDLQYERELIRKNGGPLTPKDVKKIKETVAAKREEMKTEERLWGRDVYAYEALCREIDEGVEDDVLFQGSAEALAEEQDEEVSVPRKRKAGEQGRASGLKARRMALPFDDAKYVRVMFVPFDIRIRNDLVIRAVRTQRGGAAGRLVSAILNDTIWQQNTLEEEASAFVNASKLVEPANKRSPTRQTVPLPEVDTNMDGNDPSQTQDHLFYTLFPRNTVPASLGIENSGDWSIEDKDPVELVVEVLHSIANTPDSRPNAYDIPDQEVLLRARLSRAEVRAWSWLRTDQSGSSKRTVAGWAVDFAGSHELLKLGLLEGYIKRKYGQMALRVWRVLDEKSKLDEKALGKVLLLPAGQIREQVGKLVSVGLLEQQEIPRTLDRNPSKSFFLWHVSRENCYSNLLSLLYECLVNIYVRREEEVLQQRALLRRSERRDVRENLGMLEKGDREELKTLEWKLESLGFAQERVDRDIFVLETLPFIQMFPDKNTLPEKGGGQ